MSVPARIATDELPDECRRGVERGRDGDGERDPAHERQPRHGHPHGCATGKLGGPLGLQRDERHAGRAHHRDDAHLDTRPPTR